MSYEVIPPPGAIVSAAYLMTGVDGTPRVLLEVCPHCTARTGDGSRMCFCRVPCAYPGCLHDDPMTLMATGRAQ